MRMGTGVDGNRDEIWNGNGDRDGYEDMVEWCWASKGDGMGIGRGITQEQG